MSIDNIRAGVGERIKMILSYTNLDKMIAINEDRYGRILPSNMGACFLKDIP